jgi:hypothetical protein
MPVQGNVVQAKSESLDPLPILSTQRSAPAPKPAPPAAPVRAPRLFDIDAANEQLQLAASRAEACGEFGPTRGTGTVDVLINAWGHVGRVTLVTSSFVGTPVGVCVMQAYRQVSVPAFDGEPRTLTRSFVVQ